MQCSKAFGGGKMQMVPVFPLVKFSNTFVGEGKRRSRHFTSFLWPAKKISEVKADFFSCVVGDKREKCHRISVA